MAKRKRFEFKELPHLSTFRQDTIYGPNDLWSELHDLAQKVGQRHPIGRSLLASASPPAVTLAEIEAWLQTSAPRKLLDSYLSLTLRGQVSAAREQAKQSFLEAHPDRGPKQGRPYLAGSARQKALLGVTIALLLEEAGDKLRRQCAEPETLAA